MKGPQNFPPKYMYALNPLRNVGLRQEGSAKGIPSDGYTRAETAGHLLHAILRKNGLERCPPFFWPWNANSRQVTCFANVFASRLEAGV